MQVAVTPIALALLLTVTPGCWKEKVGGGSRAILAGSGATESVYGVRAGMQLGFLAITDIPGDGTTVSAGSTWTGQIRPTSGTALTYAGSADELVINGTEYPFADGRIFLVSTRGGTVSVDQPLIPVREANYDVEIERIVGLKVVQDFLTR